MSDVVIDSSVVAKWFVPEPDSPLADRVMADTAAASGAIVVLELVFAEVVNVIWKKYRQKLITLDKARGSIADLMRSPMRVESAARLLEQAFDIAVKYDRAVYDRRNSGLFNLAWTSYESMTFLQCS